ncbi:MAG: hypothetical protein OHK0046_18190 [Anaerolineae bacterium]
MAQEKPTLLNSHTLQDKVDIQFMTNSANQKPSMEGFDPKFTDIVDYIIRITHEIWEEKAIGALYDYYANNIQIHTSGATTYGREAVIAGTIATLAAYPDRRLYGDEVIWGGDDKHGYYSSHRITHVGTNRGWSLYGPPTGAKVRYQAIADCVCIRNMIVEEWLIRDELSLIRQLGLPPVETAKRMAERDLTRGAVYPAVGDVERGLGQLPPPRIEPTDTFEPENFIRRLFNDLWNWRLINKVRDYFAETAAFEGASMRRAHGHNDYQAYILSLLSPMPDLRITPEHFCVIGDAASGYRTATRWRMRGTHTGYGIYGEPTGQAINILGVSHHLIVDGKIQNEWTLFDEFELLKQLHRPAST